MTNEELIEKLKGITNTTEDDEKSFSGLLEDE